MDEQQLFMLIGELKAGQSAVVGAVKGLTESTDALHKKVNALPCAINSQKISSLFEWKKQCNGDDKAINIEKLKGTISLKNMIIVVVITNVITLGITLITNLMIVGKP